MDLNDYLVKTFAKAVNNTTEKETKLYYGTITRVETVGDSRIPYVHLDGSDANSETPLVEGTEVMVDDRVIVTIENHKAIVMSNITSPASARTAKNYMDLSEEDEGLVIGALNDENNNYNVLIKADGVYVRDGDDILAVYGGDGTQLYSDGELAAEFTPEGIRFFSDLDGYARDDLTNVNNGWLSSGIIIAGSIGELEIADDAISTIKIKDGAIGTAKIGQAAITTAKIHDAAITNAKIENAAITTAKIEDAAITNAKISQAAITTAKIEDGAITNAKIGQAAITTAKIEDGTITNAKIGQAAITTAKIEDGAITNAKIGNAAITEAKIDDAAITNAKIHDAAITNAKIGSAAVGTANIQNAAITTALIANEAVTSSQILSVSANKLTAGTIDASEINVANLRAKNLIVEKMNGQPVLGGYELVNKNSTGYSGKNPSNEGWYEYQNGSFVVSTDTTVNQNKAYYKDGNQVALYDQAYIDGLELGLQQQIDGAVETFTGTAVPTLVNYPAVDWTSTQMASHVGDIYYVVNTASDENGYCYRFAYDNATSSYKWILIKDSDVTKALSDIGDLKTFESTTTSWINETDEGLETIRQNHTNLSGVVNKTAKESVQLWFTKANNTAPTAPNSTTYPNGVSDTSTAGNGWRTVVPTYNSSYPYYFYCWQYKFVDNTYGWSAVIYDQATTEAEERARTGVANAATADGKAVAAQNTANANIKNTIQLWKTTNSSTALSKPYADGSSSYINSVSTNGNEWTTVVPTYNASYPYYHYCYQQQRGDGKYQWSTPVYDQATSEAMKRSAEFVTFQSTTFKDVKDTVDEHSTTFTTLTEQVNSKADSSTVTTLSNTVNSVSQTATSNSSTLSQLTTTLGTNADGTTKTDDIMHRMTAQEQDLDGFKTTVSSTYQTKSDMSNYSTTTQMNSAINQKANEITTSVSQTYATQSSIPTKVSDLTNDSNFATQGYADGKASDAQAAAIADANKKLAGQFAISTTGGSTAAKVATITPAVTGWTLYTGASITVKFTTANTATTPTLNVNSTGAKTIKAYTGTAALSENEYKWPAGSTMSFVYDGTYWRIQDSTELIRLSSAESSITQTANSIVSLVANTDTYTKPDGTTATNTVKSAIKQNADNIALRVEKSGVIAAINLTSETAKIQASKVEIDGTAVFNAISSDVEDAITDKGYQTSSQVESAITGKGYQTSSQVESAITGKGYQTASQVSTAISNTSVSDLADGSTYAKKSDALGSVTTKDQYYLSTSSSSATGGSWQDTVPTWSTGKYIWIRVATTKTPVSGSASTSYAPSENGMYDSTLTSALSTASSAQSSANSAASTVVTTKQYYLSTSTSSATGGSWVDSVPTWSSGKYIWVRFKIVKTPVSGSAMTSYSPSENGVYDSTVTTALSTAYTANNGLTNKADKTAAVTKTQRIYYRSSSSSKPTGYPTAWVTESGDKWNDNNTTTTGWSLKKTPIANGTGASATKYLYLWCATQRQTADGTVQELVASDIALDDSTTVIDGGKIITGSVTASQLATDAIQSLNYTAPTTATTPYSVDGTLLDLSNGNITTPNFVLDSVNGNAYLNGHIETESGHIGGFTITDESIYHNMSSPSQIDLTGNSNIQNTEPYVLDENDYLNGGYASQYGVFVGLDGISCGFGKFSVDSDGDLHSTSGDIGGWEINADSLSRTDIPDGAIGQSVSLDNDGLDFNATYSAYTTDTTYTAYGMHSINHFTQDQTSSSVDVSPGRINLTFYDDNDDPTSVTMIDEGSIELFKDSTSYIMLTSTDMVSFRSQANEDRGIYDDTYSEWILWKSASNNVLLNGNSLCFLQNGTLAMHLVLDSSDGKLKFRPATDSLNGDIYLGSPLRAWYCGWFQVAPQTTSDLKVKSVIKDFDWNVDEFIYGLKPIAFKRIKEDGSISKRVSLGFGAQDVAKLAKDLDIGDLNLYSATIIDENEDGEIVEKDYHGEEIDDSKLSWGLRYEEFIAPMVLEIQRLMDRVDALEAELAELKNK